ncbi:lysophospholipid acyltransferase family protein [Litchfieldia alkalitelluris]|uniref:lysophospholipid acyltransferase family protein n=1 Tax=Litchfieldia alkalitelluris TaxID=304268 RepID=UPI000997BADB|nr:lysophospholipid acyltransferase family protein [Litchfieldia alkalitelluris]
MVRAVRTVIWYLYFFGYLVCSIPSLIRVRNKQFNSLEEKAKVVHKFPEQWAKALIRITGSKIIVEGKHHLPPGPALFVANHQGNFDIPVLLGYVGKPMGFISKIEVKKLPILPTWMEEMNCVFIDRKDRRQAVGAIKQASTILRNGQSLVIFPEGTRSKSREINTFKTGVLRLASDSNVPIVPIAINGTYKIMEQSGVFFNPSTVKVTILPSLTVEGKVDQKEIAEKLRTIIQEELDRQN